MLEEKLQRLLKEANEMRQKATKSNSESYYIDVFDELSNFILKKLNTPFFKNRNAKIIASYFDEILPFIVDSNMNILMLYANLLIEQPNFKEKFIEGLEKYPYKNSIDLLFYNILSCLNGDSDKFNDFMDSDILKTLVNLDLRGINYLDILNNLDEYRQKEFLNLLVINKCDIPYFGIEYKGNNKQIIYDNLSLFIQNSQNLYALMNFVKDNPAALSQVKEFIDNDEEKAMNSIFCETAKRVKITDSTLKNIIKLIVLDVMKNENVSFSEITYEEGGFSCVLLIGDKVVKLGSRNTKCFPNNPYIIAPLLRKELKVNGEACFIEVTERVDNSTVPSHEELYQLYKSLRDLGLVWTDIRGINVGRLRKDNVIYWNEKLNPSEEVLGLEPKRGEKVLKKGDLVLLDADFIYDEKFSNIARLKDTPIYNEFKQRYQGENGTDEEKLNISTVGEVDIHKQKIMYR